VSRTAATTAAHALGTGRPGRRCLPAGGARAGRGHERHGGVRQDGCLGASRLKPSIGVRRRRAVRHAEISPVLAVHWPGGGSRAPASVQLSSCVSPGIVERFFMRPDPSGQGWLSAHGRPVAVGCRWRSTVDVPGDVVGHLAGTCRDCRPRSGLPLRFNRVVRHSFGSFASGWYVFTPCTPLMIPTLRGRAHRQQPDQESAQSRSSVTPDAPDHDPSDQMSTKHCPTRHAATLPGY
jgi:hypothetical protein